MNIAFVWTQGGPSSWDGLSYKQGIGGSESMMTHYANALADLGQTVVCYTHNKNPSIIGKVRWDNIRDIKPYAFDVVIAVRDPMVLESFKAPVKAFLANDQRCDTLHDVVKSGNCNVVITISEHQKERYQQQHPIDEVYYLVSSAGVLLNDYIIPVKKDNTVMYTSTPERGLINMLDIWPRILEGAPDAKLIVTSGFQLYGWDDERCKKYSESIYKGIRQLPNCEYVGPVPRDELVRLQRKAALWAYPTSYDEMCCISALEAAAAYTPIVASNRAALKERVIHGKTGYLIDGNPSSPEYISDFSECCIQILTFCNKCVTMGSESNKLVTKHSYDEQAYRWLCRFEETLSAQAADTHSETISRKRLADAR